MSQSSISAQHAAMVLSAAGGISHDTKYRMAPSWRRCLQDYQLDPSRNEPVKVLSAVELQDVVGPMDHFLRVVQGELDRLYAQVASLGYLVLLTDAQGVALVHRAATSDVPQFLRWGLWSGAVWSEEAEGTNGVGTALAELRAVTVCGDEHFRNRNIGLTCTVAPIFDHHGDIIAAIDISACRPSMDAALRLFTQATVTQAARRIEQRWFSATFGSHWIVRLEDDEGEDAALLAIDSDQRICGANRYARARLGLVGRRLETEPVAFDPRPGGAVFTPPRQMRSYPVQQKAETMGRAGAGGAAAYAALQALASGDSALAAAVERVACAAAQNLPIMLLGETGTGKDVFARAIHEAFDRPNSPYVALNCAALPETLIDAELFGYAPGAFTGAQRQGSAGRIVEADGGTLLLDEIGDMPLALQARLLRVLENNEVLPLGGGKPVRVSLRVICATHCALADMVAQGRFRADLYYRLRGVVLHLPPLRSRPDRLDLARRLLATLSPGATLTDAAATAILSHDWPGNIRELRQTMHMAASLAGGQPIGVAELDLPVPSRMRAFSPVAEAASLRNAEAMVIRRQLAEHDGNVSATAATLGISRATLHRKIRRCSEQ